MTPTRYGTVHGRTDEWDAATKAYFVLPEPGERPPRKWHADHECPVLTRSTALACVPLADVLTSRKRPWAPCDVCTFSVDELVARAVERGELADADDVATPVASSVDEREVDPRGRQIAAPLPRGGAQ